MPKQHIVANFKGSNSAPAWSPDGSRIAFDRCCGGGGADIWVVNVDGSGEIDLTTGPDDETDPSWSPDGTRIALVMRENPDDERADQSSEALISNIYVVEVETGSLKQITHLTQGQTETPFWSPDGNTLAFNVVVNDRMDVHIADLSTGEIRTLLPESTCCPAWLRK